MEHLVVLKIGQNIQPILHLSSVNIVYFGVGESNVWTSPAIPRLREAGSRLSGAAAGLDEAWLVSCFAIGQVLGPLISGCLLDSLGRKPTTFLIILFLLISCALLAVASSAQVRSETSTDFIMFKWMVIRFLQIKLALNNVFIE